MIQKVPQLLDGSSFENKYSSLRSSNGQWNEQLLVQLGWTLVQLVRDIPGGVLVFLPAYAVLQKLSALWQSAVSSYPWGGNGDPMNSNSNSKVSDVTDTPPLGYPGETVFQALFRHKQSLIEESKEKDIEQLKSDYRNNIIRYKSCVLLGVMRAKCSEGISFNDEFARGVIIVGISYPHTQTPDVRHKKEFNQFLINEWRKRHPG